MKKKLSARPFGVVEIDRCKCGHLGGNGAEKAGLQQHDPRYSYGHGPCLFCECKQFTWAGWAGPRCIRLAAIAKAEGKS